MQITQNCIINGMPEDVYHNDPTPMQADGFKKYTSLSSSVALAIVEETEIEAYMKINRFNPREKEKANSDAINLGSIVHDKILLGAAGKPPFEVVPFDSFKTKDSQMVRDDLIARGIIPLAQNEKTEAILKSINVMEQRLHERLADHVEYPNVMQKGAGEQSGFYFDEKLGIWKRARFDWIDELYPDIVWDYKTTSLSSDKWINQELWKQKYIQCPHYTDVLSGIRGKHCKFGFVLQRTVEPFLVEIVVIDESYMDEVRKRYHLAQLKFTNCLKTDVWRGASPYTIHACPPPWVLSRWEMDELNEEQRSKISSQQQNPEQEDSGELLQAG